MVEHQPRPVWVGAMRWPGRESLGGRAQRAATAFKRVGQLPPSIGAPTDQLPRTIGDPTAGQLGTNIGEIRRSISAPPRRTTERLAAVIRCGQGDYERVAGFRPQNLHKF